MGGTKGHGREIRMLCQGGGKGSELFLCGQKHEARCASESERKKSFVSSQKVRGSLRPVEKGEGHSSELGGPGRTKLLWRVGRRGRGKIFSNGKKKDVAVAGEGKKKTTQETHLTRIFKENGGGGKKRMSSGRQKRTV